MHDAVQQAWLACDALTYPTQVQVRRDNGDTYTVAVMSLLEQLTAAINPSGETKSGSGGGKPASKPPINLTAMSLRQQIGTATRLRNRTDWLCKTRQYGALDKWTLQLHNYAASIRALTGNNQHKTRALPIECPHCHTRWITKTDADNNHTQIRSDAVYASFHNESLESFGCHACGNVWCRGDDLNTLVDHMLNAA